MEKYNIWNKNIHWMGLTQNEKARRKNLWTQRSIEIIQLEEQREKILKINSLKGLRNNIKMSNIM